MTKLSTVKARDQFSEMVNRAAYGKERIVLTRRGRELAAVVSIEDLELLEKMEEELDLEEVRKAWAKQGKKPARDWAKAKKRLGIR